MAGKEDELMRDRTVESETKRLNKLYKTIPDNKRKLVEGLIVEAARLRVRLDYLWKDIQENGETEMFSQSDKTDPYQRERPASRTYTATNKNYQSIMKQLAEMLPGEDSSDELADFLNGDDEQLHL